MINDLSLSSFLIIVNYLSFIYNLLPIIIILGYSRLGNSFLQLNKIPEAIFAFEKAAELEPSNSETQSSLSIARARLSGKYVLSMYVTTNP